MIIHFALRACRFYTGVKALLPGSAMFYKLKDRIRRLDGGIYAKLGASVIDTF